MGGTEQGAGSLARWLRAYQLSTYTAKFDGEGYDDLRQIKQLSPKEVTKLLERIPMAPGHAQQFKTAQRYLARAFWTPEPAASGHTEAPPGGDRGRDRCSTQPAPSSRSEAQLPPLSTLLATEPAVAHKCGGVAAAPATAPAATQGDRDIAAAAAAAPTIDLMLQRASDLKQVTSTGPESRSGKRKGPMCGNTHCLPASAQIVAVASGAAPPAATATTAAREQRGELEQRADQALRVRVHIIGHARNNM